MFSIVNGKGGVGKTTTAFSLAAIYAQRLRVVLVDTDSRGNAAGDCSSVRGA